MTDGHEDASALAHLDRFRRLGLRLPQSQSKKNRGPFWRIIFAVDVKEPTDRLNPSRAEFRDAMYSMMRQSLLTGRITERWHDRPLDRGDGMLVLIRQSDETPHTRLLDTVIPRFRELLRKYAIDNKDDRPLRLRAVLHAGLVHRDPWSWYGEEIDIAFRLLNAPEVKSLRNRVTDPLLLVVSDLIYQSIVSHDYPGIDKHDFARIVTVRVRDRQCTGWAAVPAPLRRAAPPTVGTDLDDVARRLVLRAHQADPLPASFDVAAGLDDVFARSAPTSDVDAEDRDNPTISPLFDRRINSNADQSLD